MLCAALLVVGCSPPGGNDGGMAGGGKGGGAFGGGTATGGGSASGGGSGTGGGAGGGATGGGHVQPTPDGGWCGIAGAWVHDDAGYHEVDMRDGGGTGLAWLSLPKGFCAHAFGNVGNAREIRFAPGGELFVASPIAGTTSGGSAGRSAIVLLPDDDGDGFADSVITWRTGLMTTQGIAFIDGGFYYQDNTHILRESYASGQRAPNSSPVQVADINVYEAAGHWPKTIDVSDNGTIYVTNGGDQGEQCLVPMPFHGGILSIDGSANGHQVAMGLRNPIYLRCHHDGHNLCFANELARDYSSLQSGREKLINIHEGDNWGYPCCASQNLPYNDVCLMCSAQTAPLASSSAMCKSSSLCSPKCDSIKLEESSFVIGDTPFGLDFVDGQFPAPWDHRVYVAVHGAFGSWQGARVVGVSFDPTTGVPYPGSNLPGVDAGAMSDFMTGWDDGHMDHGRPTDVTVSADGRLFLSNDQNGDIIWVAPISP